MPSKLPAFTGMLLSVLLSVLSPVKADQWSQSYIPGEFVYDLSKHAILPDNATVDGSWTLEPHCSSISIPADSSSTTVNLNLPLPARTMGVGLWIKADQRTSVSFQLTDGKQTIQLKEGQLQDQNMAPRQSGMTTVFKDWSLRRAHLLSGNDQLILQSITIKQQHPSKKLSLGCILTTVNGADPYHAKRVWKLKDFVTPKPNSLNWTAINYHEYGFGTDTVIRPDVLKQILYAAPTQHVRIRLTDSFQRAIQTWWQKPGSLDRGMTLPNLPKGCYFLDVDRFNGSGHLLGSGKLVYQVLRDDTIQADLPLTQMDNANDPVWMDGYVADGPSGQVGEDVRLTVHSEPIFKRIASNQLSLHWSVTDTTGLYFEHHVAQLSRDNPTVILKVPSGRSGGYDLNMRWEDVNGHKVDNHQIRYGIADPRLFQAPTRNDANIRTEQHHPIMMDMFSTHNDPSQYARLPQASLTTRIVQTYESGLIPRLGLAWRDFEPVPGCYQWFLVERYLGYAQMSGKPVGIGLGYSGDSIPQWLWFEELMSQDQQTIHAGYHYVTPMGERFTKALMRANEAFLNRYKNDWRLAGFHYYAGPSEGFLTDTPPDVSDYSPDARAKFQAYLADKYQQIEKLNQAWQTQYKSFNTIQIPQPDWDQACETSLPWTDFHFFKVNFVSQRLDQLQSRARAIDPNHIMMMYGKEGFGPTGALASVYRKNNFRYSNGGGETIMAYVQSSIMQSAGVDVQCEGHYVQPNLGSVTRTAANAILAGGYTGHNQMWGLVWAKKAHEMVPEYQAITRFNAAIAKISSELNQLQLATPWAGYHAAHQDILAGRSFRMRGSHALMTLQGVATQAMHQPCAWVDDTSELAALSRYPLIVDTHSKVLTKQSIDVILDYVKQGGTFVASAYTGRYQPGSDAATDTLMRQLGVVQINTTEQRITATGLTISEFAQLTWDKQAAPKVLLANTQNQPLIYELPLGKGRLLITAGLLDISRSTDWLQDTVGQVAGVNPLQITANKTLAAVMQSAQHRYLLLIAEMPDRSLNATQQQITSAPRVDVTISGFAPQLKSLTNLLDGEDLSISNQQANVQIMPGMLYLFRW
ncbi:MAG: hypothetical protein CMJ19_10490 [Phycisphaeraceae bacterium]|nr:hypothetical protein [Phycisphaeraceae bacterium]